MKNVELLGVVINFKGFMIKSNYCFQMKNKFYFNQNIVQHCL